MKASSFGELVVAHPISSAGCHFEKSSLRCSPDSSSGESDKCNLTAKSKDKENLDLRRTNKLGRKDDCFARRFQEHVRLGPKITDTVKGKLSLGARVLQVGGMKKAFRQLVSVREGEELLKACQCYLSTTSGPIAGQLFISTHKVAFYSERSIKVSFPNGELKRFHYKVLIPLERISTVSQSQNVNKPSQKYMSIITVDNFDFWFMGFLHYQKTFKYLQQAISQLGKGKVQV